MTTRPKVKELTFKTTDDVLAKVRQLVGGPRGYTRYVLWTGFHKAEVFDRRFGEPRSDLTFVLRVKP